MLQIELLRLTLKTKDFALVANGVPRFSVRYQMEYQMTVPEFENEIQELIVKEVESGKITFSIRNLLDAGVQQVVAEFQRLLVVNVHRR